MSDAPKQGSARPSGNVRNPTRRWLIPPTLFRDPDAPESFEGMSILQEVPGDLGYALYQLCRDLLLWAMVPEDSRLCLFQTGAAIRRDREVEAAATLAPELRQELETLALFLRSQSQLEPAAATAAALRVSRWSADRPAVRTAVLFAQAASAVSPRLASAALEAGRVASDYGRFAVAETWLRRTVALGRRSRDWESYAEALIVLSGLFWQSPSAENAARARSAAVVASRVARRHGLRMSRAGAHRQLSIISLATGHPERAEEYARRAHGLYTRQHPEAPSMLHLTAECILAQGKRERTREAIELLKKALPHRRRSRERFDTLLILMRAGAIVGDRRLLDSAWLDAVTVIERLGDGEDAAAYLFQLASEAANALEHKRATEAARRALQIAMERRDLVLAKQISALIDRARLRALPQPIID